MGGAVGRVQPGRAAACRLHTDRAGPGRLRASTRAAPGPCRSRRQRVALVVEPGTDHRPTDRAGNRPPAVDVFGPVLDQNEEAVLSADMTYSRQYGGDGRYQKADLLVVGRPAVMAAGFALSAAVNHRRKVAARREAQVRWRDHQHVQVIATTDRLLCSTAKGWLSAWYGNITEFYPDLQSWSLTIGFEPGVAPLRLSGPPAPMICLWAATCLLGERWANDPRLRPLLN